MKWKISTALYYLIILGDNDQDNFDANSDDDDDGDDDGDDDDDDDDGDDDDELMTRLPEAPMEGRGGTAFAAVVVFPKFVLFCHIFHFCPTFSYLIIFHDI